MKFAIINNNKVTTDCTVARKATLAHCPVCHQEVIPRRGIKKAHHWAHKANSSCPYGEYQNKYGGNGETDWHRNAKALFPTEYQEIYSNGKIADVMLPNGLVIEFQHSNISREEIELREKSNEKTYLGFRPRNIWIQHQKI
jgi:competence protein CoiA